MSASVQSDIDQQLRTFAINVIEQNGGVVDWDSLQPQGVAVLDGEAHSALGSETLAMSLTPRTGALWINLASDFLERAEHLLALQPRCAALRLPAGYLKRRGLEEAIRHSFTWLNAKVTLRGNEPRVVAYHTWWFHAAAVSEDRWDTCFQVSLNANTGVEVELPDPAVFWELEPDKASHEVDLRTLETAARVAQRKLMKGAATFCARMDARLARDRKRLNDYYAALLRETIHPKSRQRGAPDPEKIAARQRAVDLELRRKLMELEERYAMHITLRPLAIVQTSITVLEVSLLVHRKQARREHVVYWNPLLKAFEPLACNVCRQPIFAALFTNDQVEPRCTACGT